MLPDGTRRTDAPRDEHITVYLLARDGAKSNPNLVDALNSVSDSGHF